MDTTMDNLSQQTTRSVGSEHSTSMDTSPGRSSVSSHDRASKPWAMIILFSLHWIASWAISVFGVVLFIKSCNAWQLIYLVMYLRAGYWFATYQLNEEIKALCRKLVDQNYPLYEKLAVCRKAPLNIVSIWNSALFAFIGYANYYFQQRGVRNSLSIVNDISIMLQAPQFLIVVFCVVESFVLSIVYVITFVHIFHQTPMCFGQYIELQHQLNLKQKLRQQAELIKMLITKQKNLKKHAVEIGLLEDK